MTPQPTTALPVVLGCMTIGDADQTQTRIKTLTEESAFLDTFVAHGHTMLDTSIMYSNGTSETHLGAQSQAHPSRNLTVATKIYPTAAHIAAAGAYAPSIPLITHTPSSIRTTLLTSLTSLHTSHIDLYYFHAPDRTTPFLDSLRAITHLHAEGHFARFGISNYTFAETKEILELCDTHALLKPAVYQGLYNALHRAIEPELLPLLREHGVALYAFNPLAGGALTGAYGASSDLDSFGGKGGRFDRETAQGKGYIARYWNEDMFEAVERVGRVAAEWGIEGGVAECALRWMMHHSQLRNEAGDAVVIGASSAAQLEGNLVAMEKGVLPREVVRAFEEGWELVKERNQKYWH